MTTFNEIWNKFEEYFNAPDENSETILSEIKKIITPDNVNLIHSTGYSLLKYIFWNNITNNRRINLAKILIKEKGADVNLSGEGCIPLVFYLVNITNNRTNKTVLDYDLIKLLYNKDTDWLNNNDGKRIINKINESNCFENKNKLFYEFYKDGNLPLEIFKNSLSSEKYNSFIEYINQCYVNNNNGKEKIYTFKEIWDKFEEYFDASDENSETILSEIKNIITPNNVNLINGSNDTLLKWIFWYDITNNRRINLAKMLIKEKGADVNLSIGDSPLRWYLYNIYNVNETVFDYELIKLLYNKDTEWNFNNNGKEIIYCIINCNRIENKNKLFYEFYKDGNLSLILFQNYLSSEKYNSFIEYINQCDTSKETNQDKLNRLIKEKDIELKKINELESKIDELESKIKKSKLDLDESKSNIIELDINIKKTNELIKEEYLNEVDEKLSLNDLLLLIKKKTDKSK